MNLYFLVEGKRTERKVYPKRMSYLLPEFSQVDNFDDVETNNYFIVSGEGYPSILGKHLPNAIKDFNRIEGYSYLVVCLDADEMSTPELISKVEEIFLANPLTHGEFKIIVQNRTLETWFLGNQRMLTRAPQSQKLADYIQFYDVSANDPEEMGIYPGFPNHARFHTAYLREMFREKQISYTKKNPGHVLEEVYLNQLLARVTNEPQHLKTLQTFIDFCKHVGTHTRQSN